MNVLSFPPHRACYEVFAELAPRDLHNDVVNHVLYEALQAHFVYHEHKEQMPKDLQLQHDFSSDCIEGPYGLNNREFDDFAFVIHITSHQKSVSGTDFVVTAVTTMMETTISNTNGKLKAPA